MAYLNQKEANDEFQDQVFAGIKSHFPVEGRNQTLELESLEAKKDLDPDDLREQHKAKVDGETWSTPVYGTLVLRDKESGKVKDRKKIRMADLPGMTRRYSYVVKGQEYQVDSQWQLKPGVYTTRRQSGELRTKFNIPNKRAFDIEFNPEKKLFMMSRGKSANIPVYPLLKSMGIDDDTLKEKWGADILEANKNARASGTALSRFFKADRKRSPESPEEAEKYFLETMKESQLRPDVTKLTLGKEFDTVEGDTFVRATSKMLNVQAGKEEEDDRDSLVFKDLRSTGDFAHDRLTDWKIGKGIKDKFSRKINKAEGVRDVVKFDMFDAPIKQLFSSDSGLVRVADQVNPVEMVSSSMQTTVMGPGGIQSDQGVMDETKLVNNSHMGFLDPIHTPESERTGVVLHLPIGIKKKGREPQTPMYNLKTGKTEMVGPAKMLKSAVVLPDQVEWKDGKPKFTNKTVKMSRPGNKLGEGTVEEAQYVLNSPAQMFGMTSNLIPFMGNNSGNRASYATHHIDQAISLKSREAPLVQVGTGSDKEGSRSFEEFLGQRTAAHSAPEDGEVVEVKKDGVVLKTKSGKEKEVQLYNNFPLNDTKSVLHSTATVKVGDKVKAGQNVADTNYTKNGALALGTNLNVAYIPYKGYNFEDGVVISETAAKKLASQHMHKPSTKLDSGLVTDQKKFVMEHPEAFTRDQLKTLGTDGVVRVGQKVKTGDPLMIGTRPYQLKDKTGAGAIRKNTAGAHSDVSMRWDSDHNGEVVGVHKNKKGELTVHVRTVEPMQIGDKISGRHGNKGIVTRVIPDADMPRSQTVEERSGEEVVGKVLGKSVTVGGKAYKKGDTVTEDMAKGGAALPVLQNVEVALNPSGVPGRMNVGQVLETAAGKVARKTGKPYVVQNFGRVEDQLEKVKKELKDNGLSDTEELYDPTTGVSLGKALTGPQHLIKLTHQIDKKISARSGMSISGAKPESYDKNLMPSSGGKTGAQSIGNLGMYVMLAHGAKANIREMQTWKSEGPDSAPDGKQWRSQHDDVWTALQNGDALPTPKHTFAFQKFTDMLKASGVNMEKKGNRFRLTPLTDTQVLDMSNGELTNPSGLTKLKLDENGDPLPEKGGLFDPTVTGGHGGKKWGHFELAEPMPNPVFEGAIQKVLGMTAKQYTKIVESESAVDAKTGAVVAVGDPGSMTGGPAIATMLGKLDINKELKKAEKELVDMKLPKNFAKGVDLNFDEMDDVPGGLGKGGGTSKMDKALKRVKYLKTLNELGMSAEEAYTMKNVPVLPPAMRPASVLPDGAVKWDDLNGLYANLAQVNGKMADPIFKKYLGDKDKKEQRKAMYDGLKALTGAGVTYEGTGKDKGILHQIHGSSPKAGYFQKTLLSRRQDMTLRSTIVPEPELGLDEVGVPAEKALTLYRPFLVKKMVDIGAAEHALDAREMLGKAGVDKDKQVLKALDLVMEERPLLMKRDPALHKHSIQAFNARRVPGRAIQIHPLVTSGFNADFDGDQMSMYIPVHQEAVEEAKTMYPSNNLFNEATGKVAHTPTLESALGLYKMSLMTGDGKQTMKDPGAVLQAVKAGKIAITDKVKVPGVGTTTAGRIMIASAVPESMQKKVMTDPKMTLDKKGLPDLYSTIAKEHRGDYGEAANKLKDLGFGMAYGAVKVSHPDHKGPNAIAAAEDTAKNIQFLAVGTHSLSLDDMTPDKKTRDKIVKRTQTAVDKINKLDLTTKQKEQRSNEAWLKATDDMVAEHEVLAKKNPDNLHKMLAAGVKPKPAQYQQIKLAPMLLEDAAGKIVPTPVTKSYSEGLDMAGYWTQMHGARKGSVKKVQEVRDPGYFSKQLINTSMGLQINGDDCGTKRGVAMAVTSSDVYDRQLATDVKLKDKTLGKGTLLTPDIVSQIRAADKNAQIVVRSPLKCEHGKGLCQECAGLSPEGKAYEKGTNLGLLAAQSLGERSVQLSLKAFHSGGVAGGGGKTLGAFDRIKQLTSLPASIPDEAVLAHKSGTIEKVENDRTGSHVTVNGLRHFVPLDRAGKRLTESGDGTVKWEPPKVGQKVKAGQVLSDPNRTNVNLHQYYRATRSIEKVQNQMTNELYGIYEPEGVRRQHIETVVKAMTNLTRVRDPGDSDDALKGEFKPHSVLVARNKELVKAGKRPVRHTPVLKGVDVMPIEVQEDWMAKMNYNQLRRTVIEAAATGSYSDIHGEHPIPGMVYGAEFGMTKKHKIRAPHLKDVPEYGY